VGPAIRAAVGAEEPVMTDGPAPRPRRRSRDTGASELRLAPAPADRDRDASELLARSALGDRDAFARLYDLVSPAVYGLALRVVRDRAQAQEVAQEAFVELWRTAARYDRTRGAAISWTLTIAHRRAVDRVRSEHASRERAARSARLDLTEEEPAHEAAEANLDRQRVRNALETLTPSQRQSIELAYYGGYTYPVVASLLQLPLGTVKTRIRDGLIRLRDAMGVSE
jgi:RNA polymerase sigma-70 factor (ECF subfamily)